jgi:PKD repeat protein
MVYDAADGYVFGYSGYNYSSGAVGDDWAFQNGNWTQLFPTGTPGAHGSAGGQNLVYDPVDQYVVMEFGSIGASPSTNNTYTWTYHANHWVNISATPSPPGRWRESFAWDEKDHYAVLFGGCLTSTCTLLTNDSWSFVGGSWTNRTKTVAPPPMGRTMLQYDPSDGYLLLFGGFDAGWVDHNWSWEYQGGNWTPLNPVSSPPDRDAGSIATMGASGGVYLFGGETGLSAPNTIGDTWYYIADNWTQLGGTANGTNPGSPGQLCCSMMSWNANDSAILQFGGYDHTRVPQDTNGTWELFTPFGALLDIRPHATDLGEPIAFNATGYGSTALPYSFAWAFGDGGRSVLENTTHSYASPGRYAISLTVNDSAGDSRGFGSTVTVNPLPTLQANASFQETDANVTIGFRANTSGGTWPVTYSWSFGDGGTATGRNVSHAFASSGIFNLSALAVDAVGADAYSNFTVVVNLPEGSSAHADRNVVDVGLPVAFSARASLGTAPYTFAWSFGDGATGSGAEINHSYAAAGSFNASVWANDSGGGSTVSQVPVIVHALPSVSVNSSATLVDTGQSVNFSAIPLGGTGPYTESWNFGDGGRDSGLSVGHIFTTPGAYNVAVTLNDSLGATATALILVSVHEAPSLSLTTSPSFGSVAVALTFTANLSGGTIPFSFNWSFGDGNSSTTASPTITHSYASTGIFVARLTVRDGVSYTLSANRSVTVVHPLVTVLRASPSRVTIGQEIRFLSSPTEGLPPYTYSWNGLPGPCVGMNVSLLPCTPNVSGPIRVSVTVLDSLGESRTASLLVTVDPALFVTVIAAPPVAQSCRGPYTVNFTSIVHGGLGPYRYSWTFGDGSTASTGTSPSHSYPEGPGNYAGTLSIEDGNNATKNATVRVATTSSCGGVAPSGNFGPLNLLDLVGIALVVVAAVALGVVLSRRRRRAPPEPGDEVPQEFPTEPGSD